MTSRLRHERLSLAAFTICFVSMLFLTLGVGRVAAEQVSSTCSGVSCVRQTVWFNDSGDYYRESGSSATGATFNLVAADLYGYNIYHYGSQGAAIDHVYSYCTTTTFCTTGYGYNCSPLAPPAGCGSGTANWYGTTRHQFRQTSTSTLFQGYTSTSGTRSSSTCWNGSGSCF